jgi:pyruvate/2-oxoglutarate dehydrogenase complex dihydrolipoamide acyltransferase (E2) component
MSQLTPDGDGVVATWYARDGERVLTDQIIAEVQFDKVAFDVPAPIDGILEVLVSEDGVVPQGTVIARVRPTDG